MEIVWSPIALTRLEEIRSYIATDKPAAAERLAMRLVAMVETLRTHPGLGRPGNQPGLRELIIGGTPYIIVYRVRTRRVMILTIRHAAQQEHH